MGGNGSDRARRSLAKQVLDDAKRCVFALTVWQQAQQLESICKLQECSRAVAAEWKLPYLILLSRCQSSE